MSKTYIAGSVLAANSFPLKEIKRLRGTQPRHQKFEVSNCFFIVGCSNNNAQQYKNGATAADPRPCGTTAAAGHIQNTVQNR